MIDWTSIINTFLATLPLTIAAVTGLLVVLKKVEEIRHATNSLTDRLVRSTRIEAHAAGIKEEKERNEGA